MVYSKEEESQSLSLIDFWTIYAQNTASYAAVSKLTISLRVRFLFLMGFSEADEMLHEHKILSGLKVVTRSDSLIILSFIFCIHIYVCTEKVLPTLN